MGHQDSDVLPSLARPLTAVCVYFTSFNSDVSVSGEFHWHKSVCGATKDKHVIHLDAGPQRPSLASPDLQCPSISSPGPTSIRGRLVFEEPGKNHHSLEEPHIVPH